MDFQSEPTKDSSEGPGDGSGPSGAEGGGDLGASSLNPNEDISTRPTSSSASPQDHTSAPSTDPEVDRSGGSHQVGASPPAAAPGSEPGNEGGEFSVAAGRRLRQIADEMAYTIDSQERDRDGFIQELKVTKDPPAADLKSYEAFQRLHDNLLVEGTGNVLKKNALQGCDVRGGRERETNLSGLWIELVSKEESGGPKYQRLDDFLLTASDDAVRAAVGGMVWQATESKEFKTTIFSAFDNVDKEIKARLAKLSQEYTGDELENNLRNLSVPQFDVRFPDHWAKEEDSQKEKVFLDYYQYRAKELLAEQFKQLYLESGGTLESLNQLVNDKFKVVGAAIVAELREQDGYLASSAEYSNMLELASLAEPIAERVRKTGWISQEEGGEQYGYRSFKVVRSDGNTSEKKGTNNDSEATTE